VIRHTFIYLILSILAVGCIELDDKDKPVVLIDSPLDGDVITTDAGLRLLATLTDNTGLLQYKIVITGIDSLNDVGADSTFSITLIHGISDKPETFLLDYLIALDDTTFNGHYQLTLSCVDVEGNEAVRDTVLFRIKNSIDHEPPIITVSVDGMNAGDTLTFGQIISPRGFITDSQSLIYADIFIGRANFSDTVRYNAFTWIENNNIDFTNNYLWWHNVDSTWSQGAYHIYYTAWDNYSGVSHTIPFYVKY